MKASKALTVSVSFFRGRILWHFSLSKTNIAPATPDLEPILFPLWYWPIMNKHITQQDKVFETDFIGSRNPHPPPHIAHLLALSHIMPYKNYDYVLMLSLQNQLYSVDEGWALSYRYNYKHQAWLLELKRKSECWQYPGHFGLGRTELVMAN